MKHAILGALLLWISLAAIVTGQTPQRIALPADSFEVGIREGQKIPAFRLISQDGKALDFEAIKGPKGAALLFFRSADW